MHDLQTSFTAFTASRAVGRSLPFLRGALALLAGVGQVPLATPPRQAARSKPAAKLPFSASARQLGDATHTHAHVRARAPPPTQVRTHPERERQTEREREREGEKEREGRGSGTEGEREGEASGHPLGRWPTAHRARYRWPNG